MAFGYCIKKLKNLIELKKNKPESAIVTGLENRHDVINKTRLAQQNEKKRKNGDRTHQAKKENIEE